MIDDIIPADVFKLVTERTAYTQELIRLCLTMIIILSVLVLVQIIAKVIIFTKVLAINRRTNQLLDVIQRHAVLTDANKDRTQAAAKVIEEASCLATEAAKIIEKVHKNGSDHKTVEA